MIDKTKLEDMALEELGMLMCMTSGEEYKAVARVYLRKKGQEEGWK